MIGTATVGVAATEPVKSLSVAAEAGCVWRLGKFRRRRGRCRGRAFQFRAQLFSVAHMMRTEADLYEVLVVNLIVWTSITVGSDLQQLEKIRTSPIKSHNP